MLNIQTGAYNAVVAAKKNSSLISNSIARLSTGLRSVQGGDAAGQSVANTLEARSKSWAIAARNAEEGISAAQTAETTILELAYLYQRLFELDIQSKNNDIHQTNSDVAAYDAEAVAIGDHADYIIERASFNGISILTQNFAIDGSGSPTFNIGVSDDGDVVALKLGGNHNATKGILQAWG